MVNSEAEVVVGDRAITVRPHACSRGACLEKLLRHLEQKLGGFHRLSVGVERVTIKFAETPLPKLGNSKARKAADSLH